MRMDGVDIIMMRVSLYSFRTAPRTICSDFPRQTKQSNKYRHLPIGSPSEGRELVHGTAATLGEH